MKIALMYPELLGTYGDRGNAIALRYRATARDIPAEVVEVSLGDRVPVADVYLLGGGEDGPQRQACDALGQSDFRQMVRDGHFVFAVCAGLQFLGESFAVAGDTNYEGLGLVPAITSRGSQRHVGDVLTECGEHTLVGFENHGGVTTLRDVSAFGVVRSGYGNDGCVDGFQTENIWATYAHGPVLAQNPWLADAILARVTHRILEPLASVADHLYVERVRKISTRR